MSNEYYLNRYLDHQDKDITFGENDDFDERRTEVEDNIKNPCTELGVSDNEYNASLLMAAHKRTLTTMRNLAKRYERI